MTEIKLNYILERDIDLLIIEEFISINEFAKIFLEKINIRKYKVIKAYHSLMDTISGESDITFILEVDKKNVGILIENKIDAIAMNQQYKRYEQRGKKLINDGEIEDYYIFIAAPQKYLDVNLESKKYPYRVTYEELLRHYETISTKRALFKRELIKAAINKQNSTYSPIEDKQVTKFWYDYYDFKNLYYPEMDLTENRGIRGSSALWPIFNTEYTNIKIIHKSNKKYLDLSFNGAALVEQNFIKLMNPIIDDEMTIHRTGKSMVIRIRVPLVVFNKEFKDYLSEMHFIFQKVDKFYDFILKNHKFMTEFNFKK